MNDQELQELEGLLARLGQGDDSVCPAILQCAIGLIQRLTSFILQQDFSRLRHAHETNSVVNAVYCRRLDKALQEVRPATVLEFKQLMALQVRRTLQDLTRYRKRRPDLDQSQDACQEEEFATLGEIAELTANDPVDLLKWTEFHERAESLPEPMRAVFHLSWYLGLTGVQIAQRLADQGLTEKKVSRLLIEARLRLEPYLPGIWADETGRGAP